MAARQPGWDGRRSGFPPNGPFLKLSWRTGQPGAGSSASKPLRGLDFKGVSSRMTLEVS